MSPKVNSSQFCIGFQSCLFLHFFRLREVIANGGSRGLQVTRMVLAASAVTNRKDMFAYCDDRKNIFYFKIRESITGGGTRYPSGTSAVDDGFGISR